MHLSLSLLLCSLGIRLVIGGHLDGQLLSGVSPANLLESVSGTTLMPRHERSASTLIKDLLVRQLTCDPGYGLCPNYRCCPLTSSCCPGSGCCFSGTHCCSYGGCCDYSHYCTVVDGQLGCCPLGRICTLPPPPSPPPTTYTPPPPPPPPPPPTTYTPPPPPPTTDTPPPPPPPPPPTTAPTSSATASSTSLNHSISSIPSTPTGGPSSGTNVTISATDSSIIYTGSWTIISVTCSSIAPVKQCQGPGNSMSYTFTGTAIYLTISQSSSSGVYSVNLDGATIVLDGYSNSTGACSVSWYRVDLVYTQHTVVINTIGGSAQAKSSSLGTFEFVNFIVSQQSGPSSTSGGGVSVSKTSSIPTGDSSNGSPRATKSGMKILVYASLVLGSTLYLL